MGVYIDKAGMISLFGEVELIQLTDRRSSTGTVTGAIVDAVLDKAIGNAESEVNSYVSVAYALPLASIPEVLKAFTGDVTRYYLYDDRATEQVTLRYDRAVSWLRRVAKGEVQLGLSSSTGSPTAATDPSVQTRTQVFSDTLFSKMGPIW